MHACLIADTAWLADELAMFRFIVVGLMGEQVRVAQVVPRETRDDQTSAFGERVSWRDSRHRLVRRLRLRALSARLDAVQVNVVHALDGRLWGGSLALARRLGVPAVLSVTSARDLDRVARLRRQMRACRTAFSVATRPLHDALHRLRPVDAVIELIPLGAHVSSEPLPPRDQQALCIVITGSGVFDDDYQGLFKALAGFRTEQPGALFFFDSQGTDPHELWLAARRAGLLASTSMIPVHANHRQLLSGAHALLQPQILGRARSVTLAAMASGVPVLAREDGWIDYLIEGQTAWLNRTGDAASWSQLLRRLVDDGPAAGRLGESAREWVRERHLAASQVDRTIRLYRRLTGEAFPFAGSIQG